MVMKLPMNAAHEQMVIAGMLNNQEAYFDAMTEFDEEYFTDDVTKQLFNAMVKSEKQMSVNMLIKELPDTRLKSAARTFDNLWTNLEEFDHSFEGLKDSYLKRQLYFALNKAQRRFDESSGEELLAALENDISSFTFGDTGENIIFPAERAPKALAELWERLDNPDLAKGIPYSVVSPNGLTAGFPSLDKAFHGAHGGDLIMIAAKTGEGKTAFALNLARHFSFRQDYWGYYMNTEMRKEEMEARLLAPLANVRANEILHGVLEGSPSEKKAKRERFDGAYQKFAKSKLIMSRIPDLPLHKAKGLAKQVKSQVPNLQYLIVDYVGRMNVKGFGGSSWDELYEITKQLKELAITLDVPVFILAQRNEAGEVEGAKKMKNECDGVLFFEPVTEEDKADIDKRIYSIEKEHINYKLTKQKVRRDDNPYPIYTIFDKARNFINEVK